MTGLESLFQLLVLIWDVYKNADSHLMVSNNPVSSLPVMSTKAKRINFLPENISGEEKKKIKITYSSLHFSSFDQAVPSVP